MTIKDNISDRIGDRIKWLQQRFHERAEDACIRYSINRSKEEINAAAWFCQTTRQTHLEYLAKRQLEDFRQRILHADHVSLPDVLGTAVPAGQNAIQMTKELTRYAAEIRQVTTCRQAEPGSYVLLHFPFYTGFVMPRCQPDQRYFKACWWSGIYRDIKIIACGRTAERTERCQPDAAEILWDPVGGSEAAAVYEEILDYLKEDSRPAEFSGQMFDMLECRLGMNDLSRHSRTGLNAGWRDMLLRCDSVSVRHGVRQIFGTPVWATAAYHTCGYGWYYLGAAQQMDYYAEVEAGTLTGRYGCISEHYDLSHAASYRLADSLVASAYSDYIADGDSVTVLRRMEICPMLPQSIRSVLRPSISGLRSHWVSEEYLRRHTVKDA